MIHGMVFDLDGTIVNSLQLTFDGFNHAFRKYGHPELTPAQIMEHFGPGEKQIFRRIVGDAAYEQASAEYHAYVRERMHETPLFPEMRKTLDQLREAGMPLGIVTGRGRVSTDYILAHHDLRPYFSTIITHDEAPESKPSPAGVLQALREMSLSAEHAAYIGDMWSDVRAAHRAGCVAVAAEWDPVFDPVLINPEAPHVTLAAPSGLLGFLQAARAGQNFRHEPARF